MTLVSQFKQLNILKPKQFELMSFTGFTDIWEQRGIVNNEFCGGYGWENTKCY